MNPSPLILILACSLIAGCSPSAPANSGTRAPDAATPITIAAVKLMPLDHTLPVVGTLFANDESTLRADAARRLGATMSDFAGRVAT